MPKPPQVKVGEKLLVDQLVQTLFWAGLAARPNDIVDLYVSLKSKPLAILTGPEGSGKIALISTLVRLLSGDSPERSRIMLGHPWWAGGSENLGMFTAAQSRFTSDRLVYLIEEASRRENRNRLFCGCLTRISPAELTCLFESISKQVDRLPKAQLSPHEFHLPGPWPPNLLLLGTYDTARFNWWNPDLMANTHVVAWRSFPHHQEPAREVLALDGLEQAFLRSAVRLEAPAYQKLCKLLENLYPGGKTRPLQDLLSLSAILENYQVAPVKAGFGDAIVYLANSWDEGEMGLFDRDDRTNLAMALDRAITRSILPYALQEGRRSRALRRDLHILLRIRYPGAYRFFQEYTLHPS